MTPPSGTGRSVTGLLVLAATGLAVREGSVGPCETRTFRTLNGLPEGLYAPAWPVMQLGSLGAPLGLGAVTALAGRPRLGVRFATTGAVAWVAAKAVKRIYRRPRPGPLLGGTAVRGREASGLGYVSGHAAVVTALASAASRSTAPHLTALLYGAAPLVGLARIYVGAHLPLDVIGGAAVGLLSDGLLDLCGPHIDPVGRQAPVLRSGRHG